MKEPMQETAHRSLIGLVAHDRSAAHRWGVFVLVLVEADTGIVLNQAGRWHLRGQPAFAPRFDCKVEATRMKDELLRLFPWAEVIIRDDKGHATFRASATMRARFSALRRAYCRYHTAFPLVRLFLRAPLDPWNPNAYA
jgi:hypothetical protein